MGEGRNVYRILMVKPEGKRPLERSRRRWKDGIKMDLREMVGGCGVDSPGSGSGSLAGCCECGDEPSSSGDTELVNYVPYRLYLIVCEETATYNLSIPYTVYTEQKLLLEMTTSLVVSLFFELNTLFILFNYWRFQWPKVYSVR
jgi:hypothetical protein